MKTDFPSAYAPDAWPVPAGDIHAEHSSLDELSAGLQAEAARISPKYLYDTLGSRLFEALCLLPEYYPTRTEAAIMQAYLPQIAQAVGHGATLVDLGAGNCAKAESLFEALAPAQYVPVDISYPFLCEAVEPLQRRHPDLDIQPLGQDFSRGLQLPATVHAQQRLFFYPGSSLGNFSPAQALRFLRGLREAGRHDSSLLLGIDLTKDHDTLTAAYDDALGLTAAFNLNVLRHVNALMDADFDVHDWRHIALYDPRRRRIEMRLQARRSVDVHWRTGQRHFARGEQIHTENSYKYTRASITALLRRAGYGSVRIWTDPQAWFAVVHASLAPERKS